MTLVGGFYVIYYFFTTFSFMWFFLLSKAVTSPFVLVFNKKVIEYECLSLLIKSNCLILRFYFGIQK